MATRPTPIASATAGGQLRPLVVYLVALVGREPGGLLEVRARRGTGMSQRFYPTGALGGAAQAIAQLGQRTDVYVGCAPRRRRAGGLDALGGVWVLWADCDTPEAIARLAAFDAAPSIVVRSGTGENRHAYWPLLRAVSAQEALVANRRLAHALSADLRSAEAARILRPPGTRNFKHEPPAAVVAERLRSWRRFSARQLVNELPDPPAPRAVAVNGDGAGVSDDEPLRRVAPAVYVQALTGRLVGRDGKIACPFHDDSSPSLHVYGEPERGWYCFGCGRGGSIFDLAAEVYGLSPRGRDFIELRRRLEHALGAWAPETGGPGRSG
jgi:CHC2 zinc finger